MRTAAAVRSTLREYVRTPVLLALLVAVPAYLVALVTRVTPERSLPIGADGGTTTVASADVYGVLLTPLAAALVAGIAGLFLMQSARDTDRRLVLAGFRPRHLVVGRLAVVALVAAAAGLAAVAVLWTSFTPERPVVFAGAVALTGLTYGLVGVLLGTIVDRLPGTYAMLFGPSLDVFLFQNPLADVTDLAALLPAHYGTDLAFEAAFGGNVEIETLLAGAAYLAVLTTLTVVITYRRMRVG